MNGLLTVLGIIAFITILTSFFAPVLFPAEQIIEKESFDVWLTDAPFGTYWAKTSGRGNFLTYSETTTLKESYTVKYKVGNELKSVYLDASDLNTHVYFTDDLYNMTLVFAEIYNKDIYGCVISTGAYATYELYIPDPDLFDRRNETNAIH